MINFFYFFLFLILLTKIYSLNIHKIMGDKLKECKIKFHNQDWLDIDDCDKTNFDKSWGGGKKETTDLFIDYKLGEKVNILIKVFNNLPLSSNDDPVGFEDYCCIYLMVWINEYYLDLYSSDYVYYCSNCGCTRSKGDKTYCYKFSDQRLYCEPVRGKEYNFYIRINALNELDLMEAYPNQDYYKLLGKIFYLEDKQETLFLNFSSNSVLVVKMDSRHKVNLDELLIEYSYEGDGEFYTINDKKLNNSGKIGEDIYFKKLSNLNTSLIYKMKLTAHTISKFGKNKGTITSNDAEFYFYY